jgi:hypothetical protein
VDPESQVGRQEEQAQLASKPWTLGLKARCAMGRKLRLPHFSRTANRQLCIRLTHPVSRLLDWNGAGMLAKYLESRRNSAQAPRRFSRPLPSTARPPLRAGEIVGWRSPVCPRGGLRRARRNRISYIAVPTPRCPEPGQRGEPGQRARWTGRDSKWSPCRSPPRCHRRPPTPRSSRGWLGRRPRCHCL